MKEPKSPIKEKNSCDFCPLHASQPENREGFILVI
jgi:hypothetical protein